MKKSNLNSRITTTNAGRERMNVSGTVFTGVVLDKGCCSSRCNYVSV